MQPLNVVEKIYSRNFSRLPVKYSRTRGPISLSGNLKRIRSSGKTGIIAEFKRNSPSGFENNRFPDIMDYFRRISMNDRIGGFSVLTEPDFFHGRYEDIMQVQNLEIPILDKDFISNRQMVENAYNSGADAVLLILDFLHEDEVYPLSDYAAELGLESLIEFHEMNLVDLLQPGKKRIFGYNRRNLVTLKMEPEEDKLDDMLSKRDIEIILESGINSEYVKSHDLGKYAGLLIGASILEGDMIKDSQ